ncbi:hypothetical protein WR25_21773 [Diploscapter pachys]|uniref:Phenazine biosynthesis-like domain-containing protein n=1 Tax=Diploscapter pachys TaxID=2018661 RepID=A0A2A2LFJ7_9BILA|nr:hypothetical protein WR25_21773 [Diploscapter pachys]
MDFPQYEVTSVEMGGLWDPKGAEIFPRFDAPPFLRDLIRELVPDAINVEDVAYAAKAKKLIVVIDKKTTKFELAQLNGDIKGLLRIHPEGDFVRGIIICLAPEDAYAQGFMDSEQRTYDYACRYFAPWVGIDEDAATGSAQCAMAPYFSKTLGKELLYSFQNYPGRGAQFSIIMSDDGRLKMIGKAMTIVRGSIFLDEDVKFF